MMTIAAQIAEVKAEIALRVQRYPRLVKRGDLSEGQAAYQLDAMQAVLKTLELTRFAQEQLAMHGLV